MRRLLLRQLLLTQFLIITFSLIAQDKQLNWTPDQCLKMKNVSAVRPSPDGNKVAYTVREAIMTPDRSEYVNQIFLCNIDGSNTIQLTTGDKNSSNPKWSSDGKYLAYTSNRDGKNNLYVLPVGGGESEKVTDVKTGIGDFEWSSDSRAIAFTMGDKEEEADEKKKKAKEDWYFVDETVKQSRLYVLWLQQKDSVGKRVQKLITSENYNINSFNWSPDGKQIVFSHGKTPLVNDAVYSDISIVDVASGNAKKLIASPEGEAGPVFSPDGKYIAYTSSTNNVDWSGADHVRIYSMEDGKSWKLAATPNEEGGIVGWTADSKNIIYTEPSKTLTSIYLLSADGKKATEWMKASKDFLSGAYLNESANTIGFILQNPQQLPQAYVSSVSNYSPVKISNINSDKSSLALPKTEVIRWKAADGREIEGLLTYPMNYQKGQKVPLILNVHGGPAGVFSQTCVASNGGAYPIAAFAEMGYAVLRPNPRGSTGYGTEFRQANKKDWGGMDYKDLMLGVDEVIKMGLTEEGKLGVMGWSYGGFMSSWIVGHTDRFKAASIGAPVVDLAHQNLTDDIAGFLPSYFNSEPWADWAVYDAHSPLRFVQNVKTPVMLQHGEADARVPYTNALMFYHALKRRGVPVKLLALPRQPHGPTEPKMILQVMKSNVEWFKNSFENKGDKKGF
ncbi:MAG TPA: S9 family peptidase [Chitinophagaceae bacterium]|nr:S9 family peptidase [Chitinophagaceae bacterium]